MDEFRPPREPLVPPGGIELYARDMTATIAADVSIDVVQAKLAEVGQWLPIDGDPKLAVGELVEMNSTGPLRLGYGAWRDLLLGCQFTNGRGELITAGGRAMKNVAGYDLTKFMVGQQGIFGRVVSITTRTYKRPDAFLTAEFSPDMSLIGRLLTTSCRPQWAVLSADSLLCGYIGDEAFVAFVEGAVRRYEPRSVTRHPVKDVTRRGYSFWESHTPSIAFRASVPPMQIQEFARDGGVERWIADPVFGLVRGGCSEDALPALRRAATAVGGSLWRERGETIDESAADPIQKGVLHRLRDAFGAGMRASPSFSSE
jgi:hypothetical protein